MLKKGVIALLVSLVMVGCSSANVSNRASTGDADKDRLLKVAAERARQVQMEKQEEKKAVKEREEIKKEILSEKEINERLLKISNELNNKNLTSERKAELKAEFDELAKKVK